MFLNQDGTASRDVGIAWPSSPEDIGMYLEPCVRRRRLPIVC